MARRNLRWFACVILCSQSVSCHLWGRLCTMSHPCIRLQLGVGGRDARGFTETDDPATPIFSTPFSPVPNQSLVHRQRDVLDARRARPACFLPPRVVAVPSPQTAEVQGSDRGLSLWCPPSRGSRGGPRFSRSGEGGDEQVR